MTLRDVQLREEGSGTSERVHHVIGVDESGNPGPSEPFVLAALQCSRGDGEELVTSLIDCGLNPWQNKSKSLSAVVEDSHEQTARVERFIESIELSDITWRAAVGWDRYSVSDRAAIASTVASKTLTLPHSQTVISPQGNAVLLPDGSANTYGDSQICLRQQAAAKFDTSFQSTFSSVFVTALPKADLIYPEVTAADYIAGYVRKQVADGQHAPESLYPQIEWVNSNWREPEVTPSPMYRLRTSGAIYSDEKKSRILAWIDGRRPSESSATTSGRQFENVVARLDSEEVQTYLTDIVD